MHSVHPLPAVDRSAVARNLVLVVFEVKLIVVAELPTAKTQRERGHRGRQADRYRFKEDLMH
jgi:hypothetical protein